MVAVVFEIFSRYDIHISRSKETLKNFTQWDLGVSILDDITSELEIDWTDGRETDQETPHPLHTRVNSIQNVQSSFDLCTYICM